MSVSVWNTDVVENLAYLGQQHDHDGDDGDGATMSLNVPSGIIGIFDTSCPSDWTRVSAFDNKLLEASPGYGGTAGDTTHYHNLEIDDMTTGSFKVAAPVADPANFNVVAVGYGYPSGSKALIQFPFHSSGGASVTVLSQYGTTGPNTPHTSTSGLGGTSEPYPPYIDVVFCKKD